MANTQVVVRNLALDSTEDSVQDYFSFCGDIQSVRVRNSEDGRSKEAEIRFDSDAAASTAVLLNNALVEGQNIVVELVQEEGVAGDKTGATGAGPNRSSASLNHSEAASTTKSTVLSEIVGEAKSVASQVSTATREFNSKYDVTGKLKNAYDNAATATTATFQKLDTQYNISGNTAKAYDATKAGFSSMYRSVSGLWTEKGSGAEDGRAGSPSNSRSGSGTSGGSGVRGGSPANSRNGGSNGHSGAGAP